MNLDTAPPKHNPRVCRCCLSEGCYKDLSTEYTWVNETEIYADMLLECFDVSISQHAEGPNGLNRYICEVCITRLRDAFHFKQQVICSEKKFIDMVSRGEFSSEKTAYSEFSLKQEDQTDGERSPAVEYLDEGADFSEEDDKPLKDMSAVKEAVTALVSAGNESCRRPKRKQKSETKDKTLSKRNKLIKEEVAETSTTLHKGRSNGVKPAVHRKEMAPITDKTKRDSKAQLARIKRKMMRDNVTEVLTKSTVMPFRWLKSCYRCFYCYDIFQEASDLRDHQIVHDNDEIKRQTMNNYWESVVYMDVSDLTCKLCPETISNLYDLIDHLTAKHSIAYNKDIGLCMVAFKLDNVALNCLACGAVFYNFGPLLHHTNKDHKGTSAILCDLCGQHFKDANLLKLHVKTIHENNNYLCPECGEKFDTKSKLKTHHKNSHDQEKKYKCLVCTETFQSHYKRSKHMAEAHKNRREVKCLHCPKTFIFRSMMMTHFRDAHLKVRDHVCGVCGFKAFNSNRLKNHMYKHSGMKNFKCDACDKAFTTKKIMKAHFSRMHKSAEANAMHYQHPYGPDARMVQADSGIGIPQ